MFSRNRPDRDDRARYGHRLNRMDFCAGVMLVVLLGLAARPLMGATSLFSALGLCMYLAQRRLQDIGRMGTWLAYAPAAFILSFFFLQHRPLALGIDISLMALTTLMFGIYLTATRGDPAANRFGPRPAGLFNAAFARRAARRSVRP